MKQSKFIIFTVPVLLILGALFLFYSQKESSKVSTTRPIKIVATTYPLEYLAKEVGGEDVEVVSVLPSGVDPHEFEPSAKQVADINDATILLYNGAGLDPWAEKMQVELAGKGVVPIKATASLSLLDYEDEDGHEGEAEEESGGKDPHFWTNPDNMTTLANRLTQVLTQLDQGNKQNYQDRLVELVSKMSGLVSAYSEGLKQCEKNTVVVSHNYFAYAAKKYGLQVLSVAGSSPEAEPTSKDLVSILNAVKQEQIGYVYKDGEIVPPAVNTVATETGAKVLTLYSLETVSDADRAAGLDYEALSLKNLDSLRQGLVCN